MTTKKTTKKKKETIPMPGTIGGATLVFKDEPKVIKGSHSTRIEHADGTITFTTDWAALERDVREAIASYESSETFTKESLSKLNKQELEDIGKKYFGIDIDRRKKKNDLVEELLQAQLIK